MPSSQSASVVQVVGTGPFGGQPAIKPNKVNARQAAPRQTHVDRPLRILLIIESPPGIRSKIHRAAPVESSL
jgi:hypothetical protein